VVKPAAAKDDGAAEADGAAQFEFTFDHGLGEARDPAAGGEQAGANIIGELEAGAFVGGRLEQLAEGGEVVEAEHVLRVVAVGDPVFLADAAGMDEGADAEEEGVGLEVAAIVEMAVDVVAMGELLAGERPDAGQEEAEAFVFDVEAVEAFALGGRLFPLALPESADVEEMFERIVGRTDTFAELPGQSLGIMDGPHVQERVELFVREPGHIVEAEGQGEAGEPATAFERVGMQHLALEFEQERVGLECVGEQEGEVIVRMGRHLRPAGAAEGDHGERLVVAKSLLLFGGPVADEGGVDGRAFGGDLAAVVERGTRIRASFSAINCWKAGKGPSLAIVSRTRASSGNMAMDRSLMGSVRTRHGGTVIEPGGVEQCELRIATFDFVANFVATLIEATGSPKGSNSSGTVKLRRTLLGTGWIRSRLRGLAGCGGASRSRRRQFAQFSFSEKSARSYERGYAGWARWMRFTLDTVGKTAWTIDGQGRPLYPEGFEELANKLGRPLHGEGVWGALRGRAVQGESTPRGRIDDHPRRRGSSVNGVVLPMVIRVKSGCLGFSRKLRSSGMMALGTARMAERFSRTHPSPTSRATCAGISSRQPAGKRSGGSRSTRDSANSMRKIRWCEASRGSRCTSISSTASDLCSLT
jgi:hypothetical protein